MVKLISLYASNFKKLDFDSPLKFKDGITVISGLNEAGKSTVLDAILYALYGKVMRPPGHVKDEDLLRYGANKATVWLEFFTEGKSYKIVREIRRSGTNNAFLDELLPGDIPRAVARKSRDVTAAVQRLLSDVSFEEMISSNVVAQKDLNRLVEKGSDRSEVINAFLHLESFNKAVKQLNDQRLDLEGTGQNRPGVIQNERERLTQLRRDLEEYHRRRTENDRIGREVDEARIQLRDLDPRYLELDSLQAHLTDYDKASSRQQELLADAKSKQDLLDNHKESISKLNVQIGESEGEASEYSDLPSPEQVSKVRNLAQVLSNATNQVTAKTAAVDIKAGELRTLSSQLEGYDKDSVIKAMKSKVSLRTYAAGMLTAFVALAVTLTLSIPIIPWILGGVAVLFLVLLVRNISRMNKLVTLQKVAGKFEVYADRDKELAELRVQLLDSKTVEESAQNQLQAGLGSLTRYGALASGELPPERARILLKQYEIDKAAMDSANGKLVGIRRTLNEQIARLDQVAMEENIQKLRQNATEVELPSLPSGVEFSKEFLAQIGSDKEEVAAQISAARALIQASEPTIDANNGYLDQHAGIELQVKDQETVIEKKSRELKVVKTAIDGIDKTAELRRIKFRPGVESYMDEILPSLTSGRYKAVLLDEDFGVQVFDPEAGEYRPKDVFSGGTEDQFLLAMRLAFALALVPEAKGTTLQFLWLDEPLGSSDEVRRSGIIEYVNTVLAKRFSQIFIVSHVGGLEDQIPNIVRLENGKVQS